MWKSAAIKSGISTDLIEKNFELGKDMLKKNATYSKKMGIDASPTFLWQGNQLVSGLGGLAKIKGFEKININRNPQGRCN